MQVEAERRRVTTTAALSCDDPPRAAARAGASPAGVAGPRPSGRRRSRLPRPGGGRSRNRQDRAAAGLDRGADDRRCGGCATPLVTPRPLGPLRDVAAQLGAAVPALLQSGRGAARDLRRRARRPARRAARPVVEDLHWGDEATLDLVRFLARRIATLAAAPGAVLPRRGGRRPSAADGARRPRVVARRPPPAAGSAEPLGRRRGSSTGHDLDADDVHRRTAGNPFFVSQIVAQPDVAPARQRPRRRRRADRGPGPAGAPPPGAAVVHAREGRRRSCSRALGVPPATVEALAATGLVDRRGHGVAFRHEIARSAVLGAVTPGSEPALHAAMIDALEAAGGGRQRARPPRRRRRRSATHPALRGRRRGRGGPLRRPPRGRRVLRARPAVPGRRPGDARDAAGGAVHGALPHRPARPTRSRRGRRRSRCAASSPTSSRSARRTGRSRTSLVRGRSRGRAAAGRGGASRSLTAPATPGSWVTRSRTAPSSRRSAATAPRRSRCGTRAQRIADELGDAALHGTAAIGIAIARLVRGDVRGAGELLAAQRRRPAPAASTSSRPRR